MAVSILNLDIFLIVNFVAFQNTALKLFLAYWVSEHPLKYIWGEDLTLLTLGPQSC